MRHKKVEEDCVEVHTDQPTHSFRQTHCQSIFKMLSFFTQANLALILATPALTQGTSDRFFSEIPQAEEVALTQIVEDKVVTTPALRKGGDESPVYNLYSVALAILLVTQVKQ
jgi:bilirubin oxidase